MAQDFNLSHLKQLEAESIHIIREVVAEFENPVMMYSIGKDSSVMLHLARKAFHPGPLPFKLLHVDTTYKFKEMTKFRDEFCAEHGFDLVVHTNQDAVTQGINPFEHGSNVYTHAYKTVALKQALAAGGYDAAFGGVIAMRRNHQQKNASTRDGQMQWDRRISALSCGICTMAGSIGSKTRAFACFPFQLD